MAVPITDVLKPLSEQEILDLFFEAAVVIGLPTTAWQTGEPVYAILEIIARIIAKLWNEGVLPILSAPFLDYCVGDILTLVAFALYGTLRYEATFSEGFADIENRDGDVFSFSAGDIRVRGINGKFYTNVTGGNLAAWSGSGPYPTLPDILFRAEEIGSGSILVQGVDPLEVVSDQIGLHIVQQSAWVGQDQERDADLRVRARGAAAERSDGGPKLAYDRVARSTKRSNGSTIPITRVHIPAPLGDGTLAIYIAGPAGAVDGSDVTLIQTAIVEKVEPLCTTATVASATNVVVNVSATLYVKRGSVPANVDLVALAKVLLVEFFRTAPIGGFFKSNVQATGKVYVAEIVAIISAAHPAIFLVDSVDVDTSVSTSGVPVLGSVSIAIERIDK
jgi:hypothetical protein